ASWGMFQIMGFNHKKAGYASVQEFVDAMRKGETEQLMAFLRFILTEGLGAALQAKAWKQFAETYNGPGYSENRYDILLAQAYEAYAAT
ncbi:MAG: N-acetylmuramidase domain-containing protein, partial [Acidimicrobiales bacterium]